MLFVFLTIAIVLSTEGKADIREYEPDHHATVLFRKINDADLSYRNKVWVLDKLKKSAREKEYRKILIEDKNLKNFNPLFEELDKELNTFLKAAGERQISAVNRFISAICDIDFFKKRKVFCIQIGSDKLPDPFLPINAFGYD